MSIPDTGLSYSETSTSNQDSSESMPEVIPDWFFVLLALVAVAAIFLV